VIGAGVVGVATSWLLAKQGHAVVLVDAALATGKQPANAGSSAALGLLMANVFRRSSGRGWRLRQQALMLWQQWRCELEAQGHTIPFRPGLLQLASDAEALEAQRRLVEQRRKQGVPLRMIEPQELAALQPAVPKGALGGVFSPNDGQLDPLPAMAALLQDARRLGLRTVSGAAIHLEREPATPEQRWRVHTTAGSLGSHWLVVAAGLQSPALLTPLGHQRPQSPVLGQALELQLQAPCCHTTWPGSLSWNGINLVPRSNGRLWLGATVEPGDAKGAPQLLEEMRQLHGQAPNWLLDAEVVGRWQGLRARPDDRPAPLLEELEPGLLLSSGHYRNGVLLAPACAAWVAEQVQLGHRV
jgi:glycine/D-amino acid oxidase-like deaminating enzyme